MPLLVVINVIFRALYIFIFAHIILSWLPKDNPTIERILSIVDSVVIPIFTPFRKIVPVIDLGGVGFDLTPIVVLVLINVIQQFIYQLL